MTFRSESGQVTANANGLQDFPFPLYHYNQVQKSGHGNKIKYYANRFVKCVQTYILVVQNTKKYWRHSLKLSNLLIFSFFSFDFKINYWSKTYTIFFCLRNFRKSSVILLAKEKTKIVCNFVWVFLLCSHAKKNVMINHFHKKWMCFIIILALKFL